MIFFNSFFLSLITDITKIYIFALIQQPFNLLLQKTSMKILLADDHPLIVLGLKNAIKDLYPNTIFFEALNGHEALQHLNNNKDIDLCIIDVNMPEISGLEVIEKSHQELKHQSKSIILTLHKDFHIYETGKRLGARGYLLKEHALTELSTCIDNIMNEGYYLSPAISTLLDNKHPKANPVLKLNGQERQLLKLIEDGKSKKEISRIMVISSKSTSKSMHKICHKLEIPEDENSLKNWVKQNQVKLTY